MKKTLLSILLLTIFVFNGGAQVDLKVDLGVGITLPQFQKQTNYRVTRGIISPVLGLYPTINYKGLEFRTGIESSGSKDKTTYAILREDHIFKNKRETDLSKISVPMIIGYNVGIGKLKFKPYLGFLYHVNFKLKEEITTERVYAEQSVKSKKVYSINERYNRKRFDKTQLLAGLEFVLTERIGVDLSIALGENNRTVINPHYYEPDFNPRITYCGPGIASEINGNNYRMTINYTLSK